METFTVRPYQEGDEEEIVKLLTSAFNGWPNLDIDCTPLEYWRWKYDANPTEEKAIAVAVHRGKIVGAIHTIPTKINVSGETIIGTLGTDIAVHPEYRGSGLSSSMNKYLREIKKAQGRYFTYLATRNPRMIKFHLRESLQFPHRVTNLVRIRDLDKHMHAMPMDNPWLIKIGYSTLQLRGEALKKIGLRPKGQASVKRIDHFDEKVDELCSLAEKEYDFMIKRDREYLNWKYCDPKTGKNVAYGASSPEDELLGYIVLRINRFNPTYPIGYVVDLLTRPHHANVADNLIQASLQYFDQEGINIVIAASPPKSPHRRYMDRNGFIDSRLRFTLFFRLDGDDKQGIADKVKAAPKIFFSYGDIDSLPIKIGHFE
jgi:GNAT superfamily N-acetyltransferase